MDSILTFFVDYLFFSGPAPDDTLELGDIECSGSINVGDLTYLVEYMFFSGPPPCGC